MAAPTRLIPLSCARATALTRSTTSTLPPTSLLSSCSRSRRHQQVWQLQQPQRYFSIQFARLEKKFTKDHEWVDLSQDRKTGTIGITNYAAKALGDVVFVELPSPDLAVKKGDTIGAVESVKSASDIMTPVSGRIVEINDLLGERPGLINKGPETEEGWLARIEVEDEKEMDDLMGKEEYDEHAEGEGKE